MNTRKILTTCLLVVSLITIAQSQTSTVTATVHDPSGQLYANGNCTVQFQPKFGTPGPYTQNGASFNQQPSCAFDGTGVFTVVTTRNDMIQPSGSSWNFVICPNATSGCTVVTTQITTSPQDISSIVNTAISNNIAVNATQVSKAYQDSELILTPSTGSFYYNVIDHTLHLWNGSTWDAVALNNTPTSFTNITVTGTATIANTVSGNVNGRIYIDGTKYPATQAGVQQGITDGCALGNGDGADIYLPTAATITLNHTTVSQFTLPCPVRIHSPTMGSFWFVIAASVPSTVPTFLIQPIGANLGFYELDHIRGTTAALGQTGGDWIFLDTTNGDVSNLKVHDSSFQGQCKAAGSASCDPTNSAWFINMNTAGGATHVFLGDIENNNTLEGGINCNAECSDSWRVVHNSFGSPSGNTNPCADGTTFNNGTAMFTMDNNNGGCKGGFFRSHGTLQCLIINNQIEQPSTSSEVNSAVIDLMGDTYTITDCKIENNNIGSDNLANINVRVDHAQRTVFAGNVIGPNSTGGTGIALTANSSATKMDVNDTNIFVLSGTAVAMSNATSVTPWMVTLYTKTGTLPAICRNDTAGGIQCITNAGKSWDFQNTSNLVTPPGVGINYSGGTSGATIDATQAVAGGTFTRLALNSGSVVKLLVTTDFTTTNTALTTITGLTFTQLANATNYNFNCQLAYSQATAAVSDAFGIQAATNSPTNVFATGKIGTATTVTTMGVLPTLATTTATNIVTFTPSAITTNFPAELAGTIELPASANTVNFMVLTGSALDAITIKRGSYCQVW